MTPYLYLSTLSFEWENIYFSLHIGRYIIFMKQKQYSFEVYENKEFWIQSFTFLSCTLNYEPLPNFCTIFFVTNVDNVGWWISDYQIKILIHGIQLSFSLLVPLFWQSWCSMGLQTIQKGNFDLKNDIPPYFLFLLLAIFEPDLLTMWPVSYIFGQWTQTMETAHSISRLTGSHLTLLLTLPAWTWIWHVSLFLVMFVSLPSLSTFYPA